VALGAEHEQAARGEHPLLLLGDFAADALLGLRRARRLPGISAELVGDPEVDIAAELDVGAAAGHVGAMVTAPKRPACATIWPRARGGGRSAPRGLDALGMEILESSSDFSIDTCRRGTGWPIPASP
jgi:hypothetical protein